MKFFVVFCLVATVGFATAKPARERDCIYDDSGLCIEECPDGTHSYTTGCDYMMPEATCDAPEPQIDTSRGQICDFSACYCDSPTVRDTKTSKCVPLDQCPTKE